MRLVFIFLFFLFFGCIRETKVPKGVISQNEMRKIMWDLMRVDAYVSDYIMKDTTCNKKIESSIRYEQVFNIHSINRETFKKSLAFYEDHPNLLKPIADSLRVDEKKAQEYQNYTGKPISDTTLKKTRFIKKPVKQ